MKSESERETNVEFVTRIMDFSQSGALMQVFVIDALMKHADAVAASTPAALDAPFLSGEAWHACAVELKAEIDAKYN